MPSPKWGRGKGGWRLAGMVKRPFTVTPNSCVTAMLPLMWQRPCRRAFFYSIFLCIHPLLNGRQKLFFYQHICETYHVTGFPTAMSLVYHFSNITTVMLVVALCCVTGHASISWEATKKNQHVETCRPIRDLRIQGSFSFYSSSPSSIHMWHRHH